MGWLLFAALYAACIAYVVVKDMASYGDPGGFATWKWRWAYLGAPWLMLSEAWDNRAPATRAFKKRVWS